ncbi:hypothetical protein PCASD_00676 [Puccinia coronata f. sp. avenae]|uniref:Uncharacterized protein n=1 Tax=Puccinia coronata f. sp. avenae TaxID=200324 RepID=A0A2N5VKV4_9BASI|nr:hypothetical protein PCASD_00676 [Puccinia coronata f. sp. avenae]
MVNRDLEELNQMLQIWRACTQDDVNTGKDKSRELEERAAKTSRLEAYLLKGFLEL